MTSRSSAVARGPRHAACAVHLSGVPWYAVLSDGQLELIEIQEINPHVY